jgi:hypothetical protein
VEDVLSSFSKHTKRVSCGFEVSGSLERVERKVAKIGMKRDTTAVLENRFSYSHHGSTRNSFKA